MAAGLVAVLHGPQHVAAGPQHAQHLGQRVGIDLAGGEAVGHEQDVVGVLVDRDGAEFVDGGVDVVLVDALLSGLNDWEFSNIL